MQTTPLVTAQKSTSYTILVSLLAILGVLIIPLTLFAIFINTEIIGLLILFFILFIAFLLIFRVHYLFQTIEIADDSIVFRGFGKKYEIATTDIVACQEGFSQDKTKHKTTEYLIVHTNKHLKYELPIWQYANYKEIKIAIEKDLQIQFIEDINASSMTYTSSWTSIFYFFLFCCFVGCSIGHENTYIQETAQNGSLVEVKGSLSKNISVTHKQKDRKGSKGSNNISLNLSKYPQFSFQMTEIKSNYFDTQKTTELAAIPHNEPITLLIRQDEYEEKIAKTKPLSLFYKYYNYDNIDLYGIVYNNQVLLDKSKYLDTLEPYHIITHFAIQGLHWVLIVVTLWFTGYYIIYALKSAQNAGIAVAEKKTEL